MATIVSALGREPQQSKHHESLEGLHHRKCHRCYRKGRESHQAPNSTFLREKYCPDVHDFTGLTTEPVREIMNEIVNRTKKVGREGFQDTGIGDSQEFIDTALEALTADRLIEVSASEPVPEDEDVEEIVPENTVSFDNVAEGFRLFKSFFDFFYGPFYDMGTERIWAWTVL